MTPATMLTNLFDQMIENLTGGILVDVYGVMTAGVLLICIMLGLRLVVDALSSQTKEDAIYNKYLSDYSGHAVSKREGRAENKRQAKSFQAYLDKHDPERN